MRVNPVARTIKGDEPTKGLEMRRDGPSSWPVLDGAAQIHEFLCDPRTLTPVLATEFPDIHPGYAQRARDTSIPISTRTQSLATGLLLQRVLGIHSRAQLHHDPAGKPYVADGRCFLSLSNADGLVVLAVAPKQVGPIGVDAESMDTYSSEAAQLVFTRHEREFVEDSSTEMAQSLKFALVWTRIEAILKADGCGFSRDVHANGLPPGWVITPAIVHRHVIACAARYPVVLNISEVTL